MFPNRPYVPNATTATMDGAPVSTAVKIARVLAADSRAFNSKSRMAVM